MKSSSSIPYDILKKIEEWKNPPYDISCKKQIEELQEDDPQKLIDAFYTNLTFGTAGLRGLMGIGTNRMNTYVVALATEGLARALKKAFPQESLKVAITYDSRHHSKEFAFTAAKVLAGHLITVYITKDLRPTPFLSFTCRHKKCHAGVMITASHNPPEFNGYKVFWSDGAQVVSPQDQLILDEINKIPSIKSVKYAHETSPYIHYLTPDDDYAYIKTLTELATDPELNHKKGEALHIIYTSLHGTGATLLPMAFKGFGFTHFEPVRKQENPDPNFTYAKNPNPEAKEALELGLELLSNLKADILLATDPDADRVGCAISHQKHLVILSGNEIASICLYHLLDTYKKQKRLSKQHVVVSTIVTTRLLKKMCQAYSVGYLDTLTGFKYIGEKIKQLEESTEEKEFLFGAEESYGFLYGTYARDKDGIMISCLLCEIALKLKCEGKTLLDLLFEIYRKFGVYQEKQLSIHLPSGQDSQQLIEKVMHHLRAHPPTMLGNLKVEQIDDYLKAVSLPKSNVLGLTFEDGSTFIIRPSGTEPKIKIYGMMYKPASKEIQKTIDLCQQELNDRLELIKKEFLNL